MWFKLGKWHKQADAFYTRCGEFVSAGNTTGQRERPSDESTICKHCLRAEGKKA